ncbi:hypothetical protein VPNG_03698 [Cytospora leucostoma]|uniref:Uncharacterized protein n=1 Tax=Cytospora leucostoma TaxID=1230097 RepID=A0A423XFA0_9PEZI|nr:hypothetical protein VPNG_03698 [Cytospora leucostoma]
MSGHHGYPRAGPCHLVVLVVESQGQLVWVLHPGIRVDIPTIHDAVFLLAERRAILTQEAVVSTDRDAPPPPGGPTLSTTVAQRRGTLLVMLFTAYLAVDVLPEDAPQQPAPAHVVRVHDAAAAELDALAGVVDPGKVDVEGRLEQAEDNLDGLGLVGVT